MRTSGTHARHRAKRPRTEWRAEAARRTHLSDTLNFEPYWTHRLSTAALALTAERVRSLAVPPDAAAQAHASGVGHRAPPELRDGGVRVGSGAQHARS